MDNDFVIVKNTSNPSLKGLLNVDTCEFVVPPIFTDIDFVKNDEHISCIVTLGDDENKLYGVYFDNKLVSPIGYTKISREDRFYYKMEPNSLYYMDGTFVTDDFIYCAGIPDQWLPESSNDFVDKWTRIFVTKETFKLCKEGNIFTGESNYDESIFEKSLYNDLDGKGNIYKDIRPYSTSCFEAPICVVSTLNGFQRILDLDNAYFVTPPVKEEIKIFGSRHLVYVLEDTKIFTEKHELICTGEFHDGKTDHELEIVVFKGFGYIPCYEDEPYIDDIEELKEYYEGGYLKEYDEEGIYESCLFIDIKEGRFKTLKNTSFQYGNCVFRYDPHAEYLKLLCICCSD